MASDVRPPISMIPAIRQSLTLADGQTTQEENKQYQLTESIELLKHKFQNHLPQIM